MEDLLKVGVITTTHGVRAAMRAILRAAETKIVILSTHEELPIPVPCQIIEL